MKHKLIILLGGLLLSGCSKKEEQMTTKDVIGSQNVAQYISQATNGEYEFNTFTPDVAYAIVNSKWLEGFYKRWRSDLFDKGVVHWDNRFDCNKFAASYCAAAQIEFYNATFHSRTNAQALAIGEMWYRPDNAKTNHAIVIVISERGIIYIEPQNGKEVKLSNKEKSSIYFKRF